MILDGLHRMDDPGVLAPDQRTAIPTDLPLLRRNGATARRNERVVAWVSRGFFLALALATLVRVILG